MIDINEQENRNSNPFGLISKSDFHLTRAVSTIEIVKEFSRKHKLEYVLDVGCGTGIITTRLKEGFPSVEFDAIDISETAIIQAKKKNDDVNYIVGDGMQFIQQKYEYDIIILNNVYEHIENPCRMLIHLAKLLGENGIIIISTPNRYHIRNVIRKLFGLRIHIPSYHITEYSIGQIQDHHHYAGLHINQILTPKFKREKWRIIDVVIFKIIQPILESYLHLIKSNTKLGSLLFIVSSKN
ncbi:MAG TPA: hypothetical protein DCG75_11725 [Bacteroidales bacterium]|nr:hypothetical protein [Bacteroidales bacterium]